MIHNGHLPNADDLFDVRSSLVTLFEAIPDLVIFKDGQGRWLVANGAARKFFQLEKLIWEGKTDVELGELTPSLKPLYQACIASDEAAWTLGRHSIGIESGPNPGRQVEDFEVHKVPLFLPDGQRKGLVIIGREVTKNRRLERALKLSELMASQSRDMLLLVRRHGGRIISANEAAVQFYGFTHEQLLAKTIYDLRPNDSPAQTATQMSLAFAHGILFETIHVCKYGREVPVEVSSIGISFEGEEFLVSAIRDVSERKIAGEKLNLLQKALGSAVNGIFITERDGKIIWVNEGFSKLTGYDAEEVIGRKPDVLKSGHQSQPADFYRQLWNTILAGNVWRGEIINRRKDGTLYYENKTITPVKGTGGSVSHFICIQEDITSKKQSEEKLAASEKKFRTLFEQAPVGIFQATLAGKLIEANPTMARIFGYVSPKAMLAVGADVGARFYADPQDRQEVIRDLMQLNAGEYLEKELCFRRQDGAPIFGRMQIRQVKGDDGSDFVEGFIEDVTVRKDAEMVVQQARQVAEEKTALLKSILESPEGVVIFSLDREYCYTEFTQSHKETIQKIWGVEIQPGMCMLDFISDPGDRAKAKANFDRALQGAAFLLIEEYGDPKRQRTFYEDRYSPIRDASGAVNGLTVFCVDITARKEAEEKLRTNETRLQTWFEMPLAGIAITSPSKGWLQVNNLLCEMLGYDRQELYGMTWAQITHPDDLPENETCFAHMMRGEIDSYAMEKRFLRKNGEYLTTDLNVRCARLPDGRVDYIVALIQDITARKQVAVKLRESEERYREVVDNAHDLIFVLAPDGTFETVNPVIGIISGFGPAHWIGKSFVPLVHPDDLPLAQQNLHRVLNGEQVAPYELRGAANLPRLVTYEITLFPKKDSQGKNVGVMGVGRDVTLRKQVEAKLANINAELEKRVAERTREITMLSEVIDQSSVAFVMSNSDGSFITVNEAYAKLLGYTRAEILDGKSNWKKEMTPPEWRSIGAAKLEECLRTRQMVHFEKEYLRKDGGRVPVEVHVQPIFGEDGNLVHLRAFITDITERKQAEAALQQSQARVRMLAEVIDSSEMAFCIGTSDGRLSLVNQAFEKLTGYTREELKAEGFSWIERLTPPKWRDMEALVLEEAIRLRQPARYEKEYIHKEGHVFPVELFIQPVFDEAGKFVHGRVFVSDISERRKVADDLEEAMLMAGRANRAKSEFLAHMSHEIRTPMNVILGNTQLLQREAGLSGEIQKKISAINRSGEHLLSILNDILDLSKVESGRTSLHLAEFKLSHLLDDLMQLFQIPAKAKHLALTLNIQSRLPENILGDQQKIRQIITNLLGNAVKFTQTGGVQFNVSIHSDAGRKKRLVFTVSDSGSGIAPEEVDWIFEPFQQGHAGRQGSGGSGLGLSLCRKYAELMEGSITVQSELGTGSTFRFEFPVEEVGETAFFSRRQTPVFPVKSADQPADRILIVDDMLENSTLLVNLLKPSGFECRTAISGEEALAVFSDWHPQLILMDVRMPGSMDGLEAIRRLRKMAGGEKVKVICVSGTAFPEDRARATRAGADNFVAKPLQMNELLGQIGQLLGLSDVTDSAASNDEVPVAISVEKVVITSELLALLPENWLHQMREALATADSNELNALVKLMEPHDPQTAKGLLKLASQFDYDGILDLLAEDASERAAKADLNE